MSLGPLFPFIDPPGRPKGLSRRTELFAMAAIYLYFVPFIVQALAKGALTGYRVFLMIETLLLLTAGLMIASERGYRPSMIALTLYIFIFGSLVVQGAARLIEPQWYALEGMILSVQFMLTIFAFDIMSRHFRFSEFLNLLAPFGGVLLILSVIHFIRDPVIDWGRYNYFGIHPNLGGEFMFCILSSFIFWPSKLVRWTVYAVVIWATLLMQSRGAMISCALMIAVTEGPRRLTAANARAIAMGFFVFLALLCVAYFVGAMDAAIEYVRDKVLMVNDPFRGGASAMEGRGETYEVAWADFFSAPLFGLGVGQTHSTYFGLGIHNGFLKLTAEFGASVVFLFALMFWRGVQIWRTDLRRLCYILGAAFILYFGARSIALNIFPMIFWLAFLDWESGGQTVAARAGAAPAPSPSRTPIR